MLFFDIIKKGLKFMGIIKKLQMKGKMAFEKANGYLFHSSSIRRSIDLTISIIVLFLISYMVIGKVYYSIAVKHVYIIMPREYFPIFFSIALLPMFGFLFFKFNIWTNFWKNIEKPHLIDYLFFLVILVFLYISFNHPDITTTSIHGKVFLDMIWRGMNILDFYDYNQGTAAYQLPTYILFGIWSIPVKITCYIAGISPIGVNEFGRISGLTLMWYKLLPTLFYLGSAFIIYKVGIKLNFDKQKSKWLSFIWFIFPMAVFSQFIFGQYDSIGVFFELLMIYFFLEREILKASLICMIAVTFKVFPVFIFLPILLLVEKKVVKVIGYSIIAFSGYVFFNRLFSGSEAIQSQEGFFSAMLERLYAAGIATHFGMLSFFLITVFSVCVFFYFIKIDNKDDFIVRKYILYIPLLVYSAFFSFVLFHPQWILILTPYLILNVFINKNIKGFIYIAMAVSIGYLLTTMSNWYGNVDANLINMGIFPKIFGFINNHPDFKSLNVLASFGGRISSSLYYSLFSGMLFVNLILSVPNKKNIVKTRISVFQSSFSVERDVIWINGLIVLIFAIPSLLLFFTKNYSYEKVLFAEIPLLKDAELVKQNTSDIHTVEIIDNNIVLLCGNEDPQLYLPLQDNIKINNGNMCIDITYINNMDGILQVFYFYNNGHISVFQCNIASNNVEKNILMPITDWKTGKVLTKIRIDPPDGSKFTLMNVKIISME